MSNEPEPVIVLFGNRNPQMQVKQWEQQQDGTMVATGTVSVPAAHLDQSVTRVEFVPHTFDEEHIARALSTDNDRMLIMVARGMSDEHRAKYALAVYEAEQILAVHSAGHAPAWVACEDPDLQAALAEHFHCAQGEPVGVLTEGGRDALHEQHLKSTQPAAFKYGALSASAHTPAAADTTMEGEIKTAGGGLIRAEMTFAHTAGTNTSTLTKTWTANGSDALPVTVKNFANFNKVTEGGTMGEYDALSATSTLTTTGDNVTVTFTLTAG